MQNFWGILKEFLSKHFIVLIMWWLLVMIGILLFSDFSKGPTVMSEKIDPYVLSTKGRTLVLHEKQLQSIEENHTGSIFAGDKIKTLDSTATVFWPDGSITRLAEQSSITIHEVQAKSTSEHIQIDFSLDQGKSWSNVIRYYFGDSYFHERFNNDSALAAVRGTVFELNLERKYIHTIDHAVSIEDIGSHTGSTFVVAGGILDTDTRAVLLRDRLDSAWNKLNADADIIYLNEKLGALNQAILEVAGQKNYFQILLEKLGIEKKKPTLEVLLNGDTNEWQKLEGEAKKNGDSQELLNLYQEIYGLQNTNSLLTAKMKLRDFILETASSKDKQTYLTDFARSTLYDSWNAVHLGTGTVDGLQKKLEQYLQQGADQNLIDTLKNTSTKENIENLNSAIERIKTSTIETLGKENLLDKVTGEVNIENVEKINQAADTAKSGFLDWFKSLFNK